MRTASLINNILGNETPAMPKVGDGATILGWTDRKACTVVEISANGKRVVVQRDIATRTDSNGMSDAQSYEYAADINGARYAFTLRRNGRWIAEGSPAKSGTCCAIGYRNAYYDYSF